MRTLQQAVAILLCLTLASATLARDKNKLVSYPVTYSGGSFLMVKSGEALKLFMEQDQISLIRKHQADEPLVIKTSAIKEITYGNEAHRRVGEAIGLGVVTLGLGTLLIFTHSKKHYIGIVWDAGENKKGPCEY
jgi:hypothetical protein